MYEAIVKNTVEILCQLPVPFPESRLLAGIVKEYRAPQQEMFMNDNYHYAMGTAYLKLGILGVSEKAEESSKTVETEKQRELLSSIAIVYREISNYLSRYAEAVHKQAESDKQRHTGDMLKALSTRPPQHFDEALQLVYIMWKLRTLYKKHADLGRLDVHLRELFEKDMTSGYMSEQDVLDYLLCFWELLNENDSGDTLLNVMVGGRNIDGSDAGSRLSVLMLKAVQLCRQTEPHINVRVHPELDPAIYQAMLEVQLMGQGQATMYNDEVIIPSLMKFGIPEELACCYANDGCSEITLDGYSGIDYAHIDIVGVFELAFNNGSWADRTYRKKVHYWNNSDPDYFYTPHAVCGYASGDPQTCETFEKFYQMFLKQYEFQIRNKAEELKRLYDDRMSFVTTSVFLNGTYDFVLEHGDDILGGGFPFAEYMLFSGSIPTAADCLIAVKSLVYDRKIYTISELKEAIRVDFKGYEGMRKQMLNTPKFGNDIDEVDLFARDIARCFCDCLQNFRKESGFAVMPALYGFRFLEESYGVAATPDGRHYGDPIAEHYCATPGRAVNGPTALLNSIAKAKEEISMAVGVCAVQITLPRNLGNTDEESLMILDGLNRAAVAGGLNHMNIGIYDAELLREAQRNPEQHKDIIVRVWGYSARFVTLCKEMQDHVINRITAVN